MDPAVESRDLALLQPGFRGLAATLLEACAKRGVTMTPFFTLRGPAVQGRLWAQSRSVIQIERQRLAMEATGATWLSSFLRYKYAKTGPAVTNALPGMSWHQWGEAIDCFVLGPDGKAIWDARNPAYRVYAEEAQKLRLEAGGLWLRFPDAVHVQLRAANSPLKDNMTWPQVEVEMRKRFEEQ
jgi:hypothetical protein